MRLPLGPVMTGIPGPELGPEERELLRHPRVGGVILFSRNDRGPEALAALVAEIRGLRDPALLVAVDHEGGRVQRFREGFSPLPAARRLGEAYDRDRGEGLALARAAGWLMASELRAIGIDLSFAPVLDLDHGVSRAIGDRAFHRRPEAVAALAGAFAAGMGEAGMAAVGKHFPGHGGVAEDSHVDLPVDRRELARLEAEDLRPFAMLAATLQGMMPAHVVYPCVDRQPAGFSEAWLRGVLRGRLGFDGVVFSDDLDMAGAAAAGGPAARARAALAAGCDVVLACNDRQAAGRILAGLEAGPAPALEAMRGRPAPGPAELRAGPRWEEARRRLAALEPRPQVDI